MSKVSLVIPKILKSIEGKPGLVGVVLVGAYAKGTYDEFSDVDIQVFVEDSYFNKWKNGTIVDVDDQTIDGYWVDIKVFNFDEENNRLWSQERRSERLSGKVLTECDGKISEMFSEKICWYDGELEKRQAKLKHRMNWYVQEVAYIMSWRGSVLQGHACVNEFINWFIEYVYLLNQQFTPFVKWVVADIEKEGYLTKAQYLLLKDCYLVKDVTYEDVVRRIKGATQLLKEFELYSKVDFFGNRSKYPRLAMHHQDLLIKDKRI